jgi:glyoxylase-like metal-dependent hydrolase (beta-lactamase superfamily II)
MLVRETKNMELYMYKIEIENTGHVTNTYVIKDKDTNKLAVIDPAFDGNRIKEQIKNIGELECVLITHSHADHIAGLEDLVNGTNISVYVHSLDKEGLYNPILNEEKTDNWTGSCRGTFCCHRRSQHIYKNTFRRYFWRQLLKFFH